MKYMLFGYYLEDMEGGWGDFMGLFNSLEEAEETWNEVFDGSDFECEGQIVNATSLQVEKEL